MPKDLRRLLRFGSKVGESRLVHDKLMRRVERGKQLLERGGRRRKVVARDGKVVGQTKRGRKRCKL